MFIFNTAIPVKIKKGLRKMNRTKISMKPEILNRLSPEIISIIAKLNSDVINA